MGGRKTLTGNMKKENILERLRAEGLLLATNNAGKLAEFRRILNARGVDVFSPRELDCEIDVEETADSFQGNAALKAVEYYRLLNRPVLADDSGLSVDALQGEPGVYSARFGGPGLDDRGRRVHLLKRLEGVPEELRTARFVCVLALTLDGEPDSLHYFTGEVEGRILPSERGEGGFGYDAVFEDLTSGRSFAELSAAEKDDRSHRGRAIARLLAALDGPC